MPPDTIVATVNGQKMTADEIRKMVAGLPAQVQNAFTNDPHQFMKEYAWYQVQQASALKTDWKSRVPWKELFDFQRMMTLVQAEWNDAYLRVEVTPEQQQKYYETNKEKYRETQGETHLYSIHRCRFGSRSEGESAKSSTTGARRSGLRETGEGILAGFSFFRPER